MVYELYGLTDEEINLSIVNTYNDLMCEVQKV